MGEEDDDQNLQAIPQLFIVLKNYATSNCIDMPELGLSAAIVHPVVGSFFKSSSSNESPLYRPTNLWFVKQHTVNKKSQEAIQRRAFGGNVVSTANLLDSCEGLKPDYIVDTVVEGHERYSKTFGKAKKENPIIRRLQSIYTD